MLIINIELKKERRMTKINEINKSLCFTNFRTRKAGGHKGNFGKVLIIAGSEDYPGAGIMAANGALRSGVGIVTLALPDCLKGALPFHISPEIILRYLPSEGGGFGFSLSQAVGICSDYDAILVGCGWGKSSSRLECLKHISSACNSSLILDADALNLIAENEAYEIIDKSKAKTLITPHIGEFTRLLRQSFLDLELQNRLKLAKEFAEYHKTIVVQKSALTIVTNSEEDFVCYQPNSGLAKGGSGDLLAGLIAGIIASKQCKDILSAAVLGVHLHSQAGLLAKNVYTECGMTISDVADYIPMAWAEFLNEEN